MERGTIATASPLTVRLDSSDTAGPALRLESYTPVNGDRVVVDQIGSPGHAKQLVILGKVV
jgi:hypothetical protein